MFRLLFIIFIFGISLSVMAQEKDLSQLIQNLTSLEPDTNIYCLQETEPAATPAQLKCKDTESPLFKGVDANDALEVEIISNLSAVNSDSKARVPALMTYKVGKEEVSVGGMLSPRGNSRQNCSMRPFKFEFSDENELKELALTSGQDKKNYEDLMKVREKKPLLKGVKQDHNIFDKLGKDIKIVNPCEVLSPTSFWHDYIGSDTHEERESRLLREYYIYKMLEVMNTTTLKTRLAKITYKDFSGEVISSSYSFFREPESKAIKRCGLEKAAESPDIKYNQDSRIQTDIIEALIGNSDFSLRTKHNMEFGKNQKGEVYYFPYDFDLALVVSDRQSKESPKDLVLNSLSTNLSAVLTNTSVDKALVQVKNILTYKESMLAVIQNSILDRSNKDDILLKLNSQFKVLEDYVAKNSK